MWERDPGTDHGNTAAESKTVDVHAGGGSHRALLPGRIGRQGDLLPRQQRVAGLAAVLLLGYRFWPGVALGAVLFTFQSGKPIGFFTLGTAIGNTMGAIVCTF